MFSTNTNIYRKDDFVWCFKYAPKSFDDLILLDRLKSQFEKVIKTKQMSDMLLYGPPGLGKTTIANVLKHELDLDVLYLNGSIDNSIDDIRTTVRNFTKKSSMKQKMVFVDEMDKMTAAQDGLKAELEQCQKTSFLFTTNHIERIIPPLISRCGGGVSFFYDQKEKKELQKKYLTRIFEILKAEEVEYVDRAVAKIIQKNFPDMRNTIHDCQRIYQQFGKIDENVINSLTVNLDELFSLIKSKQFDKTRYYVSNMTSNATQIYNSIIGNVEKYVESKDIAKVIDLCYEHQKSSAITNDPQIPMIHFLVEMMSVSVL